MMNSTLPTTGEGYNYSQAITDVITTAIEQSHPEYGTNATDGQGSLTTLFANYTSPFWANAMAGFPRPIGCMFCV